MKQYETYSPEDLANDEYFLNWVKYPERNSRRDAFWRMWMEQNPSKAEAIEEARQLILAVVREKQFVADEAQQREVWERIKVTADVRQNPGSGSALRYLWHAAVVMLAVATGWFAAELSRTSEPVTEIGVPKKEWVSTDNNGNTPKILVLEDGSTVTLQPNSALEYPRAFAGDVREVKVQGEAFFEVMRDPARPFIVHADALQTRVLGTSFSVRNFDGENNVIVRVKTGKVSVYRAAGRKVGDPVDKSVEGVVLMPNQQVAYERFEMKMIKSLVENPTILKSLRKNNFEFEDAPISEVFSTIEQAYGVDIVFDEDALSTCFLNASLTDVPLYDKLKLICKGINATYEIIDSHIVIYGRGCRQENNYEIQ